jgi:hypothetical protein
MKIYERLEGEAEPAEESRVVLEASCKWPVYALCLGICGALPQLNVYPP